MRRLLPILLLLAACQTAATMGGSAGGAALGAAVGGPGGAAAGAVGGALGGRAMAEELLEAPAGVPVVVQQPIPRQPFSVLAWLLGNLEALILLGLAIWFMPAPHVIVARLRAKWRKPDQA